MRIASWRIAAAFLFMLVASSSSFAQSNIVSAEQVQQLMTGGGKVVLIDVRTSDEYKQGHIPGAIHISADRIAAEKGRLPKDRNADLIFYCRGVG